MIPGVPHPTANPIIGIVVAFVIYFVGSKILPRTQSDTQELKGEN